MPEWKKRHETFNKYFQLICYLNVSEHQYIHVAFVYRNVYILYIVYHDDDIRLRRMSAIIKIRPMLIAHGGAGAYALVTHDNISRTSIENGLFFRSLTFCVLRP